MFRGLHRREGKRIVAELGEQAEPIDQIADLLRLVGEDQSAQPAKFSGAKKAQPTDRRHHAPLIVYHAQDPGLVRISNDSA